VNTASMDQLRAGIISVFVLLSLLSGCTRPMSVTDTEKPTPAQAPTATSDSQSLTSDQVATLSSLQKVDDHPLYVMHYTGAYANVALTVVSIMRATTQDVAANNPCSANWGCSLFAAMGDQQNRLYGRNFDWRPSPVVLLFTDPPDGYASVSMVDIEYLGFTGSRAQNLSDLSLSERRSLLDAPFLPFDGMNEKGLAIGMAAVPSGDMRPDPTKKTIDELAVIREILDHASTVDEAVHIFEQYNIDMGNVPLHYLIASVNGDSALVEFYRGKMVVDKQSGPFQLVTNFIVASTNGNTAGQCPRYDRIKQQLGNTQGKTTPDNAMHLLSEVAQSGESGTQWSVVYHMTNRDVRIVMSRKYGQHAFTYHLDQLSK
jgi:hypothetical protein